VFEIIGGTLILIGLLTRLAAAIPLIIDMLVAISSTKVPNLLKSGFWAMAHAARVDYAILLGSLFLLIVGADGYLSKRLGPASWGAPYEALVKLLRAQGCSGAVDRIFRFNLA
jgi:uncharacterized membrane protein YphA (DoxX/SURF4 family)